MLKDTLITMADGTQKLVKEIEIGDIILGYDFESNATVPAVVLWSSQEVFELHGAHVTFSNYETLGIPKGHTLYCVEFDSYLPIENWREGYHSLDVDGNEIEALAIYWNVEGKNYNQYYVLSSSNNTYFANNILNAKTPVEKQRRLARLEAIPVLNELAADEAKGAGCMQFTVTNKEFLKKALPFQNKIKTSQNRIEDLEKSISEVNSVISKVAAGLPFELPDADLKHKYVREIEGLKSTIKAEQVEYNKLLAQYSDLGDDILLDEKERNKKYFKRAVKLANENFELYRSKYLQSINKEQIDTETIDID